MSAGAPSPRLSSGGLLAAAGLVAGVTLAARAAGLVRWVVFSQAVGATCVGQVYSTANLVPNVLFEVAAGGALAAVAVPLVAGHLHRGDEALADRTASALMTWTLTVLLPLAAVVALAAGPLTAWLLGTPQGCSQDAARDAGALMLLLFAPQIVLYGIGIVLAGVLQAHRRFLAAALAPLLSSLVVIGVYVLYGLTHDAADTERALTGPGLWLLAGGTTLGVVALSLPLLLPASRLGVRWRPTWRFPAGTGRRAGALVVAGVVVVLGQQLAAVVVLLLTNASTGGVAGITVWTYAQTVYLLPYAVLVVPLATAAFPRLTAGRAEAIRVLRGALLGSLVASVAAAAALVAARREIGRAFLLLDAGRDHGGRATLEALAPTVALLAPGVVGFALVAVGTRALYAVGSPRRAAAAATIGWATVALVPLVAVAPGSDIALTLRWLAIGSSTGMTFGGALLLLEVVPAWGPRPFADTGRAVLAALLGAGAALAVRDLLLPTAVQGWLPTVGLGLAAGLLVVLAVALAIRWVAPEAWRAVRERMGR